MWVPETNAAWRKQNLGYRLFAANTLFVRDKLNIVRASGFTGVTDTQLSLFINVDRDGTRITDIATRSGLTKQSVVELVDRAEKLGAVRRDADPFDKRTRTVRFTPLGTQIVRCLHQAIVASEQRFTALTGYAFAAEFKLRFGAYSALPIAYGDVVGGISAGRADPAWRSGNVGRVFALASRRFANDALHHAHLHGDRKNSEVLLSLFRNLDLDGTRLTDIAVRAHMTKQSMRELVDRAEALGLVERRDDPTDRRARIIAFTAAGLAMLEQMRRGLAAAETDAGAIVGEAFLARTRDQLTTYIAASSAPGASA